MDREIPQEGDAGFRAWARAQVWYHATPWRNVAAIEREGLKPRGLEHTWRNGLHLALVNLACFVDDYHALEGADTDPPAVLYRVSLEGLPDDAITPGWDNMAEQLAIYCTVPPENLTRVR